MRCHQLLEHSERIDTFERCGAPEDHPIHDPSSDERDRHPFSPDPHTDDDLPDSLYRFPW